MPWLVIYIGLLFPIMLLLVVLAIDWRDNSPNDRRQRACLTKERPPKAKLV
jgi:hypothetical protein